MWVLKGLVYKGKKIIKSARAKIASVSVVVTAKQSRFSGRQFHCLITVQSHPQFRAQIPSRAGAVSQSKAMLGYF